MKSPKNVLILLLAALAAAAGLLAWRQHLEIILLRAAYFPADQREALQKAAADAQQRVARLEAQLGSLRRSASVPSRADGGPVAGGMAGLMSRLDSPEMQRLMALQARARLSAVYGPLFRDLHLTPAQIDQLKGLLVDRQLASMDVMMTAAKQGVSPMEDPDGFRQLVQSAQSDVDSKIKSELGDDGYAAFQAYQQSLGQRAVVSQLQQSLSSTDTPLTDAQASQLMQILQQSSPAASGGPAMFIGGPAGGAGGGAPASPITDAAVASAQGVLSAPQLQALQEIQQQQQASAQLGQEMMRGGGGPGPGGGPFIMTAPGPRG